MDYAWETILTKSPHEHLGVQEGGGGHDNSSMQEFQKHKQALRALPEISIVRADMTRTSLVDGITPFCSELLASRWK